MEVTNKEVQKQLMEKIKKGIYHTGNLIVPQKYEKVLLKNGQLLTEEMQVSGRKIPVRKIRTTILQKQEKYMRVRTDSEFNIMSREQIITGLKNINEFEINDENSSLKELLKKLSKYERTRSLSLWYDGLTHHGHLLMMAACLYDSAVFLTDDECKEKYNMEVNVQPEVEKPELYTLARCQSNDNKLLYSEERVKVLSEINTPITSNNGVLINDVMRIFKSDDPAAQPEAGHQKGGDYFCWLCSIEAAATKNIFSLKQHLLSLQDRVSKVLMSSGAYSHIVNGDIIF